MEGWEILALILQTILGSLPFILIIESDRWLPWIKKLISSDDD